mgnify:FL=1
MIRSTYLNDQLVYFENLPFGLMGVIVMTAIVCFVEFPCYTSVEKFGRFPILLLNLFRCVSNFPVILQNLYVIYVFNNHLSF